MAARPIYLDPEIPLKDAFSELPAGFRAFLKTGFGIVSELTMKGRTAEVVKAVLEEDNPARTLARARAKEIASGLGISAGDVPKLVTTVAFTIALFTQKEELTSEQFLAAAGENEIIEETQRPTVQPFVDFVAQNRAVSAEIADRNQVVSRLLPSMTRFATVIDVRPAFSDDGEVRFSVPVVLARLENDSTDDVWFQMSKKQVQQLIGELQEALRKVEIAEKWYHRERDV